MAPTPAKRECVDLTLAADTPLTLTLSLAMMNGASFLVLLLFARNVYQRVDISHPVFAVAFQDAVVLCVSQAVEAALVAPMAAIPQTELWMMLYQGVALVGMEWHQVSWLCVTMLRYYLLIIKKDEDEIDMDRLRRRSLLAVRMATIPLLVATFSIGYGILIMEGWPGVRIHEIDEDIFILGYGIGMVVANIPDYVSIGIFFKMSVHFWKKKNATVHPAVELEDQGEDFGGIWVGGAENGGGLPVPNVGEGQQAPHNDEQDEHKAKAVMKTLKISMMLSLLDMTLIVLMYYKCYPLGKTSGYLHQIVSGCWIPFFVVKSSFKQMDGFLKGLCCKAES